MIFYSYKKFFVNLLIIIFILIRNVSAQEDISDIYTQPQNIVPDAFKEKEEIDYPQAINKNNEVMITELPITNIRWIGNLGKKDGGLGLEMWKGTDSTFALTILKLLPVNAPSPAMRNLAKRLLLSDAFQPSKKEEKGLQAISPSGKPIISEDQEATFLPLRFAKLASLGAKNELIELGNLVPTEDMLGVLAKEAIYARLLSGETNKVCDEVIELAKRTNESYWRKALIVCQLILGNRDDALLSLELLLAELDSEDKFSKLIYTLADETNQIEFDKNSIYFKILIAVLPGKQLDKHRLNLDPSGLSVVAKNNNLSWKIRMLAAEKAVLAGSLSSIYLGELATQFEFEENIFSRAATESKSMEGFMARALLLKAAALNTSFIERARFLRLLLDSADSDEIFQVYASVIMPILLTVKPRHDLIWFASSATRASIAGGNYILASEWLAVLAKTLDLDYEASGSLLRLLPLIAIAGQPLPKPFSEEQATDVWSGLSDNFSREDKEKRASRLLVLLSAMGIEPRAGAWKNVISSKNIFEMENIPATALRYQLLDAAKNNRIAEVVSISLIMLGSEGPSKSGLVALNAVIRALREIGLEADARAIAIEAAISYVN
ncbi:MAG: hypothetical protein P8L69_06415 [Alphaproteobacteria bacterium]|nr:hypothetical protein [Alphaproteobacteria bacterium]